MAAMFPAEGAQRLVLSGGGIGADPLLAFGAEPAREGCGRARDANLEGQWPHCLRGSSPTHSEQSGRRRRCCRCRSRGSSPSTTPRSCPGGRGRRSPKTRQLNSLTGAGALGGSFWGLLFGLIFFVPLLGLAIGAGMGALAGSMSDVGIDDDFIRDVRKRVTPGSSALFLLISDVVQDKVLEAFAGQQLELIHTNLGKEQELALRQAFSDDAVVSNA